MLFLSFSPLQGWGAHSLAVELLAADASELPYSSESCQQQMGSIRNLNPPAFISCLHTLFYFQNISLLSVLPPMLLPSFSRFPDLL